MGAQRQNHFYQFTIDMKSLLNHSNLSLSQRRAVEMDESHSLIIQGAPGSGKTRALLHRAASLAESQRISHTDYRIFLTSADLDIIERQTLQNLGIPVSSVMTFRQWCIDCWNEGGLGKLPLLESGMTDDANLRAGVLTHIQQGGLSSQFRFAMVDDGQDLDVISYEIITRIAKHLTVATHDGVQIVDGGLTSDAICSHIGLDVQLVELNGNFRNSKPVAKLASQFGPRLECCVREALNKRLVYATAQDAYNEMISLVGHLIRNDSTRLPWEPAPLTGSRAVLVPNEQAVELVRQELPRFGLIPVTVAEAIQSGEESQNASVTVVTFEGARGLTFDNVLMPTLEERFWQDCPPPVRMKMLFLGVTRATRWVYVSLLEGSRIEEHGLFRDVVAKGIMRHRDHPGLFI